MDVLSVGQGHMSLKFDYNDPIERARAERVIKDMLKRGYALFVQHADGTFDRVKRFDPVFGEYIIADGPTVAPTPIEQTPDSPPKEESKPKRLSPGKVKTVVVGRSAGG